MFRFSSRRRVYSTAEGGSIEQQREEAIGGFLFFVSETEKSNREG